MKQFKIFFALAFVSLLFTNCDPNDSNGSNQNDTTFAQNFGASASRDFIGQVVDADNHPLQNVTIKIGTSTVQTDVNGVFIINGAAVHEKFAHITATKTGYIDGSRSMVPTTGKNNVKIMMVSNTPVETIQSGTASEVSIYSGTKVNFDGAFQDENGNAYSGSVQVSMFHLTSSDENIDKLMPGMLYAQTQTNEAAVLETYGMLNVELRGSAGQKLNIASGHTAEITLRIDDSQLATAPNSIPLWHFDEEKGYWKEDGVATKVGNKYVGEVSHFSWWNYDMYYPTITLTANVVDNNGNPIADLNIKLLASGFVYPTSGTTNTGGQVSGSVPANQTMALTILNVCGNIIYTATIGPFTNDTVLPNIVLNASMSQSSIVQGTLLKCDNTNVTNGYVVLNKSGTVSIYPVTNGTFSFNEAYCSYNTNFTLKGYDYDNLQTTGAINYTFTSPVTTIGNLMTCNDYSEFISYQIDSNPSVVFTSNITAYPWNAAGTGESLHISAAYGTDHVVYLSGDSIIPGVYTSPQFRLQATDIGYIGSGTIITDTIQYNLNSFGNPEEYIDMTFSGTYVSTIDGLTHTLTGVVHVIRTY